MKHYRVLAAIGIASLALARTYTGPWHTFWLVYSMVGIVLYFIGFLLDVFGSKA